jgi:hypothetical protein
MAHEGVLDSVHTNSRSSNSFGMFSVLGYSGDKVWEKFPEVAKELLLYCLHLAPKRRIACSAAPWQCTTNSPGWQPASHDRKNNSFLG